MIRISDELRRLADEARPVDLYPQVLATSRRLYLRRVTAVTVAVVAAVVFGGIGAFGVSHLAATAPPGPLDRPPTPAPTTADEPERGGEGVAPPPRPTDSAEVVRLAEGTAGPPAGRTLYFATTGTTGGIALESWRPGDGAARRLRTWPYPTVVDVTPSPDGQWVAWTVDGALKASHLDGSAERTVRPDLSRDVVDGCFPPAWTADARRVLVRLATGTIGLVDLRTGGFQALPGVTGGCHFRFSADGRWLTWVDPVERQVWLAGADGTGPRAVSLAKTDLHSVLDVDAISPDGRRLALVGIVRGVTVGVTRVLDVSTGTAARYSGQAVLRCLFAPDGTLVMFTAGPTSFVDVSGARLLWRGGLPDNDTRTLVGLR